METTAPTHDEPKARTVDERSPANRVNDESQDQLRVNQKFICIHAGGLPGDVIDKVFDDCKDTWLSINIADEIERDLLLDDLSFTNEMLKELTGVYSKAPEYDRAIRAALLNWTSGIAHNIVKYNVEGGLDAWRKLYSRYI